MFLRSIVLQLNWKNTLLYLYHICTVFIFLSTLAALYPPWSLTVLDLEIRNCRYICITHILCSICIVCCFVVSCLLFPSIQVKETDKEIVLRATGPPLPTDPPEWPQDAKSGVCLTFPSFATDLSGFLFDEHLAFSWHILPFHLSREINQRYSGKEE